MPRIMAPPPSGEFQVALIKPFSGTAKHTIQITGEPNRPATVLTSTDSGSGNKNEKTGEMSAGDVQELLRLTGQLRGLPSHPTKDIYGADVRLELHTFDINWTNAEDDPSGDVNSLGDESKTTFKDVADSIEAAARTFAKQPNAV
ncbi:hypothetical protein CAC42_1613 [Sphaceloma murrayae]|uniref:Uncharacterized protein n=1 Tax=Sphaceloma murrayae TaxID=2082308 RepID=A0A2K1R3B1_9PEZI|nr:hypothetical protein CAC42_1613 [Sphaceloma murrayae]